jgi:uncharacterized membrane protein
MMRRDLLAAIGVFGLAMNLLGAFGPFLALAGIAQYIVEHWVDLSSELWVWLFSFVNLEIPPLLGFALSFLVFHMGLVASASRFQLLGATPPAIDDMRTENRNRLLCLILYIPIMGSTLLTAFYKLAETSIRSDSPANSGFITLALILVVAAPILTFSLVRPRKLMRRFLSVYVVAFGLLLLGALSRFLESIGVTKSPV